MVDLAIQKRVTEIGFSSKESLILVGCICSRSYFILDWARYRDKVHATSIRKNEVSLSRASQFEFTIVTTTLSNWFWCRIWYCWFFVLAYLFLFSYDLVYIKWWCIFIKRVFTTLSKYTLHSTCGSKLSTHTHTHILQNHENHATSINNYPQLNECEPIPTWQTF